MAYACHCMVMTHLSYPTTQNQASLPISKPRIPKSVIDVSSWHVNDTVAKKYTDLLDYGLCAVRSHWCCYLGLFKK